VNRLAHLDADALVGHNISAFDLDILLHRLEKHKARLKQCLEYICNDPSSRTAHTRPLAA
jgi:DNA polymerase III epsilon subunit-like protein